MIVHPFLKDGGTTVASRGDPGLLSRDNAAEDTDRRESQIFGSGRESCYSQTCPGAPNDCGGPVDR
jgi:hypothetical protein